MRTWLLILLLPVLTPGWDGASRLGLLGPKVDFTATPVALDASDPARRTVGRLTYLGGVELKSPDPVFGGFSSLTVEGRRFTLLSDGGNIVRFDLDGRWGISARQFAELPGGPDTGWRKRDRDSESIIVDPATGDRSIGFEFANAIWRYDRDLTRVCRHAAPRAMRKWNENGGPEAMVRLADGATIVFSETTRPKTSTGKRGAGRIAIRFAGDPTARPNAGFRFLYMPPADYDPSDAALLPDGRILVLNRAFTFPFNFTAKLTIVDPKAIRPGERVRGEEIATFAAPVLHDNFEGIAVVREGDDTVIWMVSDDNQLFLQRSLLLKFRLDPAVLGVPGR
ncbi:esterase-like activity of phytase family protein [Sphingomonas aliaeris]|uniref:Esterase-like activity of phytase family protein n=1 Tax=Sphingomonas aliaeris TaxID=2759526 RepID=A0A974NVF0_9SPHN|nr:esterase-like activity of phytase family protein [Sphingomonas aliaeris]QQV77453.1 esterase-like activity of phytase family protein [Sphingomonas aliaeris]